MIIVPELETVFVLVPRTGSGVLYRELRRVYPRAFLLYRHMEADGCPQGYDRWRRVGFVRHPTMRLWSLYNFMRSFKGGAAVPGETGDAARVRKQVDRSFDDWVLHNTETWTAPFDLNGDGKFWPLLARRNAAPENKLSQFQYLRPDLGTEVLKFEYLRDHMEKWGLNPHAISNKSNKAPIERPFCPAVAYHIATYCAWDLQQNCDFV